MRLSLALVALLACKSEDAVTVAAVSSGPWFRLASTGIAHRVAEAGYGTLQGRMAGGVCALDANTDGKADLFFPGSPARLYLQIGPLRFEERPFADPMIGSGCVAADIDGDGDDDLVLTGYGGAKLLLNEGGSFTDASARLGTPFRDKVVTTAAVAFDADRDGDLDLAITSYGVFKGEATGCNGPCASDILQYDYGSTVLLLQRPDGTFEDASARLGKHEEPGLVATATDLNGDGIIDLFVGNDIASFPDRYYRGDGKGGFTEIARELGVAFNSSAGGVYSMSATDGDVDGDGFLDLTQSSWDEEASSVYRCTASGCSDIREELELFRTPRNFRWGQALEDLDDDGLPELFEAAGHYQIESDQPGGITRFPTEDAPLLWHRRDNRSPFVRQTDGVVGKTGGRGVIALDLDGDGDLDLVVASAVGPALILENIRQNKGHWLNVRLRGKAKNTRAIGARIVAGRTPAIVHAGGSFLSSDNGGVHFGLGPATKVNLEITWPTGAVTKLNDVAADQALEVQEP